METTDILLTIVVVLLALTQVAVLVVSILLLLQLKKITARWHHMVENLDKSVAFAKNHVSRRWPIVSMIGWGIGKLKNRT